MTARTVSETEAQPASYPAVTAYPHRPTFAGSPAGEGDDAVLAASLIWQRIEAYIAHRWTARSVVYIAEGPGWWQARLAPFTVTTKEVWEAAAWASATLDPTPYGGLELPGCGPYRITGTAGDDTDPPEAVLEAWRRLHEFSRGIAEQFRNDAAYVQNNDTEIVRGWTAKAMQLSGAADLLRPYRRLGVE